MHRIHRHNAPAWWRGKSVCSCRGLQGRSLGHCHSGKVLASRTGMHLTTSRIASSVGSALGHCCCMGTLMLELRNYRSSIAPCSPGMRSNPQRLERTTAWFVQMRQLRTPSYRCSQSRTQSAVSWDMGKLRGKRHMSHFHRALVLNRRTDVSKVRRKIRM
jgi:hypothetical protein